MILERIAVPELNGDELKAPARSGGNRASVRARRLTVVERLEFLAHDVAPDPAPEVDAVLGGR